VVVLGRAAAAILTAARFVAVPQGPVAVRGGFVAYRPSLREGHGSIAPRFVASAKD